METTDLGLKTLCPVVGPLDRQVGPVLLSYLLDGLLHTLFYPLSAKASSALSATRSVMES